MVLDRHDSIPQNAAFGAYLACSYNGPSGFFSQYDDNDQIGWDRGDERNSVAQRLEIELKKIRN